MSKVYYERAGESSCAKPSASDGSSACLIPALTVRPGLPSEYGEDHCRDGADDLITPRRSSDSVGEHSVGRAADEKVDRAFQGHHPAGDGEGDGPVEYPDVVRGDEGEAEGECVEGDDDGGEAGFVERLEEEYPKLRLDKVREAHEEEGWGDDAFDKERGHGWY
jgi:hypothetical protein